MARRESLHRMLADLPLYVENLRILAFRTLLDAKLLHQGGSDSGAIVRLIENRRLGVPLETRAAKFLSSQLPRFSQEFLHFFEELRRQFTRGDELSSGAMEAAFVQAFGCASNIYLSLGVVAMSEMNASASLALSVARDFLRAFVKKAYSLHRGANSDAARARRANELIDNFESDRFPELAAANHMVATQPDLTKFVDARAIDGLALWGAARNGLDYFQSPTWPLDLATFVCHTMALRNLACALGVPVGRQSWFDLIRPFLDVPSCGGRGLLEQAAASMCGVVGEVRGAVAAVARSASDQLGQAVTEKEMRQAAMQCVGRSAKRAISAVKAALWEEGKKYPVISLALDAVEKYTELKDWAEAVDWFGKKLQTIVDLLENPHLHQDRFKLYREMLEGSLAAAEATFEDFNEVGTSTQIKQKTDDIRERIARIDSTLTSLTAALGLMKLHLLEITFGTNDVWPGASSAVRDVIPSTVTVVPRVGIGSTIVLILAPRGVLQELAIPSSVVGVPIINVEDLGKMVKGQITRSIRGEELTKCAAPESITGLPMADTSEAFAKKPRLADAMRRLGC